MQASLFDLPAPVSQKIVLVGESNPYGADPYYALYPAPNGCSGHRLCTLILGMHRAAYLETFERVNLCAGPWKLAEARASAEKLHGHRMILLGAKVCAAFRTPFQPFVVVGGNLVLPHPSGLCRLWGQQTFLQARQEVLKFAPELHCLIGSSL